MKKNIDYFQKVIDIIEDKKADNIKVYDLTGLTPYYDKAIICTSNSQRNASAIVTDIKKELGNKIIGLEGVEEASWILMDISDFLVHIFDKEARDYYDLDGFYSDVIENEK